MIHSREIHVNRASPINIDANKHPMDVNNRTVYIDLNLV
jgi:hypothetical protein